MKNDLIVKGDNWVNLCNLPRYNGKNRLIKWNDCAGLDIEYFYNNKNGIIHIKEILGNGLIIISLNSNNKELKIRHDIITRCMLYDFLSNVLKIHFTQKIYKNI